ncbi:head GIN domain-containing protein [Bacteroidota bacterium]
MKKNSIGIYLMAITLLLSANNSFAQHKEERNVSKFSGIDLGVAANLIVRQETPQKVVLSGDENVLELIKTEVEGDKLRIYRKDWGMGFTRRIDIYISVADINELNVSGSGNIEAETPIKTNELEMNISGSGDIIIDDLSADQIEAKISGSGNLFLNGNETIQGFELKISGSGELKAEKLPVNSYEIKVSGSGSALVNAIDKLEARISGSGKVLYYGSPKIDAEISGSGKVASID